MAVESTIVAQSSSSSKFIAAVGALEVDPEEVDVVL
jgi:hypothetical protein